MGHPQFEKVVKIIKQLRHPQDGCPWDIKQTHQTLTRYLIEEAYEFQQACQEDDSSKIEDEIGDVLLQVLLHCSIADESGAFNLESVSKNLANKMVRRHPHVFNIKQKDISIEQVKQNWDKIKAVENKNSSMKELSYLPALLGAHKIGEKTHRVGFDWKNAHEVIPIVKEELKEFLAELPLSNSDSSPSKELEEEFGDLLFSMAQMGRHLNINAEEALQQANNKFIRRFNRMKELILSANLNIDNMGQHEMDNFWKLVKKEEHA